MKSAARLGDSAATMHGTVGGRADIGRIETGRADAGVKIERSDIGSFHGRQH